MEVLGALARSFVAVLIYRPRMLSSGAVVIVVIQVPPLLLFYALDFGALDSRAEQGLSPNKKFMKIRIAVGSLCNALEIVLLNRDNKAAAKQAISEGGKTRVVPPPLQDRRTYQIQLSLKARIVAHLEVLGHDIAGKLFRLMDLEAAMARTKDNNKECWSAGANVAGMTEWQF